MLDHTYGGRYSSDEIEEASLVHNAAAEGGDPSYSPPPITTPSPSSLSTSPSERATLYGSEKPWQLSIEDFKAKVVPEDRIKLLNRKTGKFYEAQNALIDSFEHTLDETVDDADEREKKKLGANIAIYGSFGVNVFLAVAKLYAAIVSGSLAVIASSIDSFLDLLSGSIIFVTNRAMKSTSIYKYPAGKTRLEPIGIIIFAACMGTATLQLIFAGIRTLASGHAETDISTPTLVIVGLTIFLKLILHLYCRMQTSSISALAYAQDHLNDVFTNTIGLGSAVVAFYYPPLWWMDAVGGILMGLYILVTWCRNGWEQVQIVAGKTADAEFLSKATFLCWNHHHAIKAIDTVRAFHVASGYSVEIDIVLPPDMPLQEAHDIGESLQIKFEKWEEVERCFVHLDYETEHKPEHKWVGGKKEG